MPGQSTPNSFVQRSLSLVVLGLRDPILLAVDFKVKQLVFQSLEQSTAAINPSNGHGLRDRHDDVDRCRDGSNGPSRVGFPDYIKATHHEDQGEHPQNDNTVVMQRIIGVDGST